jgi:HSP20 family protein
MTIVRRTGFGDLLSLRQAMDRLFEESFVNPRTWSWGESQLVPMDVYATDDDFVVEASLPGVKPEEVDITVEGNTLTIAGETRSTRKDEEGSTLFSEIRRGSFSRTMSLPAGLEPDKAKATFEDGVLTLRIPKAEQVKPRQIKITSEQARSGEQARFGEQARSTGDGRHAKPATVEAK